MAIAYKYNIFTNNFDIVDGAGGYWSDPVANKTTLDLITTDTNGSVRVTLDTNDAYRWTESGATWNFVGKVKAGTFGSTPNSSGFSVSTDNTVTIQPADGSNPGAVSTTTQTLAGNKTLSNNLTVSGTTNADGGIDRSTSGTLTIGATNSTTINIGNAGATVNIQGTTIYENTPILKVVDPLITINSGGVAGSGQNSGIEVEENAIITGYVETSSDRNSWSLKAPNTAGVANITPGASGITLDQSSHNPVTLGALGSSPNGNAASLSTQVLTLQPADGTNPGVVTAGTQSLGGAKTLIDTTQSSSKDTGCLILEGGLGVEKNTNIGGNLGIGGPAGTYGSTIYAANNTAGIASFIFENNSTIGDTASTQLELYAYNGASSNVGGCVVQTSNSWTFGGFGANSTSLESLGNGGVNLVAVEPTSGIRFLTGGWAAENERGRIDSSGHFGIGNVSPANLLDVGSSTYSTAANYVSVDAAASVNVGYKIRQAGADKWYTYVPSGATTWKLDSALVNVITATQAGGVTVPFTLSVTGTTTVGQLIDSGATINTVAYFNGSKQLTSSNVSPTELSYLSGVITETSFSAANNQASAANVTGLAFANATVRSAEILLSVYVNATSPLYESYKLYIIQKASSWAISATSVGDDSGFDFTITNAGQIQYTSGNSSGFVAATIKFRALTLSV